MSWDMRDVKRSFLYKIFHDSFPTLSIHSFCPQLAFSPYLDEFLSRIEMRNYHILSIVNSGEGNVKFSTDSDVSVFWQDL